MIPRHQRVLFWTLLLACVVMSVLLIRLRERAHDRMLATAGNMPLTAPEQTAPEHVTLMIANDTDGSLVPSNQPMALPADPDARARVILQKLISVYALEGSTHPIGPNNGVDEIFLLTLPPESNSVVPGMMAVVNLSGSFAQAHPSGIEPETLTLLSIIGTLRANLPQITQVRFLIDGQPHDTLAGHADLTRTYLTSDAPGVRHL